MKKMSHYLLAVVLVFAPIAFGTTEFWSLAILESLVALLGALVFVSIWHEKSKLLTIPGLLPLLLLLAFMVVQIIPLPPTFVKFISPAAYAVYQPVNGLNQPEQWISLSINQKATIQELLRFATGMMMYCLTVQLLSKPQILRKVVSLVIWLAALVAGLAIIQNATSPDYVFWIRKAPAETHPFGPWVNPNQFAGYIEMIAPLALGLFLFYRPRSTGDDETWQTKFVRFFNSTGTNTHLFLGVAFLVLVLSIFLTMGRGGILSISFALLLFQFLYTYKRVHRRYLPLVLLVCCLLFLLSWAGWDRLFNEFDQGVDSSGTFKDGRLQLWSDTLQIIKDYPFLGSGFGTFVFIYPLYKTIPGNLVFDHAHNDYLELLTDGGIVGTLLAGWFIIVVMSHSWRMIAVRRDRYAVLVGIGTFSGICAILLHSLTDFNLHNGAVGMYFFFLCGLLVAVVNSKFGYSTSENLLLGLNFTWVRSIAAVSMAVLVLTLMIQGGAMSAKGIFAGIENVYVSRHLREEKLHYLRTRLKLCQRLDPLESLYSYQLANVVWYLQDHEGAKRYFLQAGMKNPMEGVYLQRLGLLQEDEKLGRSLMLASVERAIRRAEFAGNLAEYLLKTGNRDEANATIKEALRRDPKDWSKWILLLDSYNYSEKEIGALLPANATVWFQLGRARMDADDSQQVGYFFDGAVELLEKEQATPPPEWWYRVMISYYKQQGQRQKALAALRQAVEKLPKEIGFHVQMGDYYLTEGLTVKAEDEFKQVLLLDPGNKIALDRLRAMGIER